MARNQWNALIDRHGKMMILNKAIYPAMVAVTSFCFFVQSAEANPAPIGSPGSTLVPFSLKTIPGVSIAEETLLIEDGKSDTIPSPAPGGGRMDVPCVQYHARYQFENKTGKAKTIKVGFPIIVYSEMAGGSYGGLISPKAAYGEKNLVVSESSRPKPMIFPREKLVRIIDELRIAGVAKNVAESSSFIDLSQLGTSLKTARTALLRSKTLTKKQIDHCLNVLKQLAFVDSDEKLVGQSLLWYTFDLPLPVGLSEVLDVSYKSFVPFGDDYSFSYVLSTARFWNNQTKRLTVEIVPDAKFQKTGGTYEILPKEKFVFSSQSNRYTFHSKNRSPNFDIFVKRIVANP